MWTSGFVNNAGMFVIRRVGDEENGIPPGTLFEELPEDWECLERLVDKSQFTIDYLRTQ